METNKQTPHIHRYHQLATLIPRCTYTEGITLCAFMLCMYVHTRTLIASLFFFFRRFVPFGNPDAWHKHKCGVHYWHTYLLYVRYDPQCCWISIRIQIPASGSGSGSGPGRGYRGPYVCTVHVPVTCLISFLSRSDKHPRPGGFRTTNHHSVYIPIIIIIVIVIVVLLLR